MITIRLTKRPSITTDNLVKSRNNSYTVNCIVCTLRKWDEQLVGSLAKHIPDFCERKPQHVSLQLGVSSTARRQLADQLTHIFTEKFNAPGETSAGFGLIGLHPCGDLAATLLRFYEAEEEARFICIVGCCYMKMTLRSVHCTSDLE